MTTLVSNHGRPKTGHKRRMNDTGTPELIAKRIFHHTAEALDLCLERGIVTQEQHWCGIHLRWLYTLRFGAPGVRATDPLHMGGREAIAEDPRWRALREVEYNEAIAALGAPLVNPMLALCVFNERPAFLQPPGRWSRVQALRNAREADMLLTGFAALERLWCRKKGVK